MVAKASERIYEDFVPASDLISEEGCDTLLVHLPGFKKEQLKVQLTTSGILKISGEHPVGGNKWKRFHKDFCIPSNCDTKGITAKFEGGIIYIRQPKLITQVTGKPTVEAPKPQPQQLTQPPQPQPQQEVIPKEFTKKEEVVIPPKGEDEEEKIKEKEERKEEMHGEDEERREKWEIAERVKQLGGDGGFFNQLVKPENVKKIVVSAVGVMALGFYIAYMFKSLTGDDEQSFLEYNQEL